jgi:hypothetical protein
MRQKEEGEEKKREEKRRKCNPKQTLESDKKKGREERSLHLQ